MHFKEKIFYKILKCILNCFLKIPHKAPILLVKIEKNKEEIISNNLIMNNYN